MQVFLNNYVRVFKFRKKLLRFLHWSCGGTQGLLK